MLIKITDIEQPYSGEYQERIYDIESVWNADQWAWIKFEEDEGQWVGNFRGRYLGAEFSVKHKCIVVLTTAYLYILDLDTKKLIDYQANIEYEAITCTPFEDILITDGYCIKVFRGNKIDSLAVIEFPISADSLQFSGYEGNTLIMECEEFLNWSHSLRLVMDCSSFVVSEN